MSVSDFLAQLNADKPDSGVANSDKNRNRSASGTSRTTPSTFPPLSPRPPGSPPAAGAFRITTEITTTYAKDLHELIQRITPGNGSKCLQATFDVQSKVDDEGRALPSFWAK